MRASLLALVLLAGCAPIDPAYVAGERATYDAIAPEYLGFVRNAEGLGSDQIRNRERTVESWDARISAAEKELAE